ncbi:MAG TPA: hypothetical protein VE569_13500 [Acidimicrobiia bacterium]|jgi:hypothetical protein|nr:hypothetical protein [Acidimicrobiia bacterium]
MWSAAVIWGVGYLVVARRTEATPPVQSPVLVSSGEHRRWFASPVF